MLRNAIATLYLDNYRELADLVNPNKDFYCNLWGYDYLKKTSNFTYLGFDKIKFLRENIENHNWIWWQDLDSIITNPAIRMESIIESTIEGGEDLIISYDRCGINAGSFLVKNSENGIKILDFILSKENDYKNHVWQEQQVLIENISTLSGIKIVDQKRINSYLNWHYGDPVDAPGTWSEGDVLLHLPGMTLDARKHYIREITQKCKLN
jgi:hypothetical protein